MKTQAQKENAQNGTVYWEYYFKELGTRPLTLEERERLRNAITKELNLILNNEI